MVGKVQVTPPLLLPASFLVAAFKTSVSVSDTVQKELFIPINEASIGSSTAHRGDLHQGAPSSLYDACNFLTLARVTSYLASQEPYKFDPVSFHN